MMMMMMMMMILEAKMEGWWDGDDSRDGRGGGGDGTETVLTEECSEFLFSSQVSASGRMGSSLTTLWCEKLWGVCKVKPCPIL